jgi:hypothetical protein
MEVYLIFAIVFYGLADILRQQGNKIGNAVVSNVWFQSGAVICGVFIFIIYNILSNENLNLTVNRYSMAVFFGGSVVSVGTFCLLCNAIG